MDPLCGSLSCHGKWACTTQRSYELSCAGVPKMDRSLWRVLVKCGPLEKKMTILSSIPAKKTPWTIPKG